MNEIDIPIDIHCTKLLEWLISRRIVPRNFQSQIHVIRNKIADAINDMPDNENLRSLLSGSHINYFHCKSIVEILKQTEIDTKSVFGTYGSKRMKDWLEILKLYEKDNVYLAESAQILIRYQTYEVPILWRQMDKCEEQSVEALKKVKDLYRTEQVLKHDHTMLCQQLGIKGINLREELTERLKELPKIYEESISEIDQLDDAMQLYAEYTNKRRNLFPVMGHLIISGNTTVYEYIHKEAPIKIEENPIKLNLSEETEENENNNNDEDDENDIDFGLSDDNGNTATTTTTTNSAEMIDFGDLNVSEEIQLDTTGDIDWGETHTATAPAEKIDFDVKLEEYDIVVEDVGMDGGIAKGDQAYTILDSPSFRDKFIDELYELESFLLLRLYELNMVDTSANIMVLLENASTYDAKSIERMLAKVNTIICKVCSEQTQHLFQLKHSSKYADIIASKLKQKLQAIEKVKLTQEQLKEKSARLIKEKQDLRPVADDLIKQIKMLQSYIESDISKKYKNRVVNLMGGLTK